MSLFYQHSSAEDLLKIRNQTIYKSPQYTAAQTTTASPAKKRPSSSTKQLPAQLYSELKSNNKIKKIGTLFTQNSLIQQQLFEKKEQSSQSKSSIIIRSHPNTRPDSKNKPQPHDLHQPQMIPFIQNIKSTSHLTDQCSQTISEPEPLKIQQFGKQQRGIKE